MRSQLESSQHWYELPSVAEAAPLEFLQTGWNWLVNTCESNHSGYASSVVNLYAGYCLALEDEEARPHSSVLSSYLTAIDEVGRHYPAEFVNITRPSWDSENAVVHRMLLRGLCEVGKTMPSIGLEYLLGDARRFQVGTLSSHDQSESIKLIQAISPGLALSEVNQLEMAILSWSMYRESEEPEGDQIKWDREARLRLLAAIDSPRLTPSTRGLLEQEKLALPGWDREGGTRTRAGSVRQLSPISKEEMRDAPNEQVLKAIEENPADDRSPREWVEVEGGWEEPGGAAAAGREIAELIKEHPARAMQIIQFLVEKGSEEAAAAAIHGLADSDLGDSEAMAFLATICRLSPQTKDLQADLGYALYRRCKAGSGLSDELCNVLNTWLNDDWSNELEPEDTWGPVAEGRDREVESVLWSRGGLVSLRRPFFILMAITNGYLMRSPAACDEWLDVVKSLLGKGIPRSTWSAYVLEFRWIRLKGCNRERGTALVEQFFRYHPVLRETKAGIQLIAHIADLMSSNSLAAHCNSLRESQVNQACQGYAELLTLIEFRGQHNPWAKERLESELAEFERVGAADGPLALGFAFAAAKLWDDSMARPNASAVLCRLLPYASPEVSSAIATVFWTDQQFPADEQTQALFRACADNPDRLAHMSIVYLVEQLESLTVHMRTLARDVCKSILSAKQQESDLFEAGPSLVSIAMTLQRFADTRDDGLSLLEDMMRMGLDDAFRILRDIDVRPENPHQSSSPTRRRRRRRR